MSKLHEMNKAIKVYETDSELKQRIRKAIDKLTPHERDLLVPCPARGCNAKAGKECKKLEPNIVHFGRRLKFHLQFFYL